MRKTTCKKLTCLALSLLMCSGAFPSLISAADTETTEKTALQEISESFKFISYAEYKEKYADVARGTSTVTISAVDYKADETDAAVEVVSDYQGKSGKALMIPDAGKVTWEFEVPKEGMYAVAIDYCYVSDKTNSIERTLYINGLVPCSEARYLLMKKTWRNNYTENAETGELRFEIDGNGNELRPTSYVDHIWKTYEFIDSNTYYANPFEFYFEKGTNSLSLEARDDEMAKRFEGGAFATIYLAPFNYHRIHSPATGTVVGASYCPGTLWPVNVGSVERVEGLFCSNERLTSHIRLDDGSEMLVVKVGATNVGRIGVAYTDELLVNAGKLPRDCKRYDWKPSGEIRVEKGGELGRFEMGSTVILVVDKKIRERHPDLFKSRLGSAVKMGEAL